MRPRGGGGAVEDFAALGDGARDGVNQPQGGRDLGGQVGQEGIRAFETLEGARQVAGGYQGGFDVQQFMRFQHGAAAGLLQDGPQVARPPDAQVGGGQEGAGFLGEGQAAAGLAQVGGRAQAARQIRRGGKGGVGGQFVEDFGVFEDAEGLGIHKCGVCRDGKGGYRDPIVPLTA